MVEPIGSTGLTSVPSLPQMLQHGQGSGGQKPGVHWEDHPRDPSGLVTGQKYRRPSNVPCRSFSAQRPGPPTQVSSFLGHGRNHGCVDMAWSNAVYPDILPPVMDSHGCGLGDNATLGRRVWNAGPAAPCPDARNGRNVDNRTTATLGHGRNGITTGQHHAL